MTKLTPPNPVKVPLIDNPSAPVLFADEAVGFVVVNNTLRITFASVAVDHTKNPATTNRVVTGRLVMPLAAAESLRTLLTTIVDNFKARDDAAAIRTNTLQ